MTANTPVLPLLTPPSKMEAEYYYLGLPSKPRLVGRTTAGVLPWAGIPNYGLEWSDGRYDPDPAVCLITPIGGQHRALQRIEGILPQIMDAMHVLPWTCIDLLRIGSSKMPMMKRPIVLWVGIGNESRVEWDNVALALRQVRRVLDGVDLTDVECEIREANTVPLCSGSGSVPPALFAPVREGKIRTVRILEEARAKRDLSTALGQVIIPSLSGSKSIEGTLGVYVRPKGRPHGAIWALTCRHVCLPLSKLENTNYRQMNPAQRQHAIYSPSDRVLKYATDRVESTLEDCTEEIDRLTRAGPVDADEALFLENQKKEKAAIRGTFGTMQRLEPWQARKLGSVFLSPAIAAPLGPDGAKRWTRNWGLVDLLPAKFPAAYTKNEVDLRENLWNKERNELANLFAETCFLPPSFTIPKEGLLPIQGVVPMSELEWICSGKAKGPAPYWFPSQANPEDPAHARQAKAVEALKRAPPMFDPENGRILVVGKRGKTTGLTWGALAEFRSAVRTPHATTTFVSRALTIVGTLGNKSAAFSAGGDSGALVFDVTGRAVALLTAGEKHMSDTTYCTPLELILDDVSKEVGEEVVLL